ncbi:DUF2490 domain-containing protein [Sphingomonas jatrophae]|uniref:DUF2490 domain-containing protein n=1 Tax=Sphingomonas jatrophae TaxID=1166337 RepID=A0A1I6MA39_9SPHN|nr:DUF2490 domain-containing protein [Sphingomonas jatrophae]SFS12521.1 Protein of unknown function [Sphingomonas jatrophae]
MRPPIPSPTFLTAIAALLIAGPVHAAQQDEQLWLQANTNLPLAAKLRVTLEQIARFGDRPGGLYQTEFGALLGYRISKQVELGFGYRRVGLYNSSARDEDRLRQQVVATFGRITTRFRVDERFHPEGSEIGFRIRPLIRYNHPLGPKGLAAFISHESFLLPNATSWGQRSGYERMRNIIGLAVPIGRRMSADMGYLNQYRPPRSGASAQMDHALSVQLTINLPQLHAIVTD